MWVYELDSVWQLFSHSEQTQGALQVPAVISVTQFENHWHRLNVQYILLKTAFPNFVFIHFDDKTN